MRGNGAPGSAPSGSRTKRRITRLLLYSAFLAALSATDAVIVSKGGASVEQDPAPTDPPTERAPGEFPKESRGDLGAPVDSSLLPEGAVDDEGLGPSPGQDETNYDEPDSSAEGTMPDTGAVLMQIPAAADSGAPMDTLRLTPPATDGTVRPSSTPPAVPPKARSGVLGVHPVAILLGLTVLSYFIVKAATN